MRVGTATVRTVETDHSGDPNPGSLSTCTSYDVAVASAVQVISTVGPELPEGVRISGLEGAAEAGTPWRATPVTATANAAWTSRRQTEDADMDMCFPLGPVVRTPRRYGRSTAAIARSTPTSHF
jgi:hypothetical protein